MSEKAADSLRLIAEIERSQEELRDRLLRLDVLVASYEQLLDIAWRLIEEARNAEG